MSGAGGAEIILFLTAGGGTMLCGIVDGVLVRLELGGETELDNEGL